MSTAGPVVIASNRAQKAPDGRMMRTAAELGELTVVCIVDVVKNHEALRRGVPQRDPYTRLGVMRNVDGPRHVR